MKVIGLLGGMSWESTVSYYQIINRVVRQRLGGLHSAKCLLYSVDFAEIEACQAEGRWDEAAAALAGGARRLERGGADFFLICTNTMHKVASQVAAAVQIPLPVSYTHLDVYKSQPFCLGRPGHTCTA